MIHRLYFIVYLLLLITCNNVPTRFIIGAKYFIICLFFTTIVCHVILLQYCMHSSLSLCLLIARLMKAFLIQFHKMYINR